MIDKDSNKTATLTKEESIKENRTLMGIQVVIIGGWSFFQTTFYNEFYDYGNKTFRNIINRPHLSSNALEKQYKYLQKSIEFSYPILLGFLLTVHLIFNWCLFYNRSDDKNKSNSTTLTASFENFYYARGWFLWCVNIFLVVFLLVQMFIMLQMIWIMYNIEDPITNDYSGLLMIYTILNTIFLLFSLYLCGQQCPWFWTSK